VRVSRIAGDQKAGISVDDQYRLSFRASMTMFSGNT
jgi:hypothetical protein